MSAWRRATDAVARATTVLVGWVLSSAGRKDACANRPAHGRIPKRGVRHPGDSLAAPDLQHNLDQLAPSLLASAQRPVEHNAWRVSRLPAGLGGDIYLTPVGDICVTLTKAAAMSPRYSLARNYQERSCP
jgi:hypothetical protein